MSYLQELIPARAYDRNDYERALRASFPRGRAWAIPLTEEQDIQPGSILSQEVFGRVTISTAGVPITPNGIPSGEAWGIPSFDFEILPNSIVSSEAWGTPIFSMNYEISAYSIFTGEQWGAPQIIQGGEASRLSPVLEYVQDNEDGTFTAYWGWLNTYLSTQTEPIGALNKFVPSPADKGQGTSFVVGRQYSQFSTTWNGSGNVVWSLRGTTATAGAQI